MKEKPEQQNEQKNCSESCACNISQQPKTPEKKPEQIIDLTTPAKTQNTKEENKPDPTRFGDWELKGRAIDF